MRRSDAAQVSSWAAVTLVLGGDFLASQHGPDFNLKVAIQNTDLPSMNDIFRAYGRFDVASGKFSVYSEVAIKDGNINGYIKPLFANVEVYDYQKDKSKSVLHQAKELVIGGQLIFSRIPALSRWPPT